MFDITQLLLLSFFALNIGAFLWYIIQGLTYPDETVQSLVTYVFIQLCSSDILLPVNLVTELCKQIPLLMTSSRLNDYTINLMGK